MISRLLDVSLSPETNTIYFSRFQDTSNSSRNPRSLKTYGSYRSQNFGIPTFWKCRKDGEVCCCVKLRNSEAKKPRNFETKRPINFETEKPRNQTPRKQKPRSREAKKRRNDETTTPRNPPTKKPRNKKQETKNPRNFETV